MSARTVLLAAVLLLAPTAGLCEQLATESEATPSPVIDTLLRDVRKKWDVPALAGAIVTSDGLVEFGVVGVRKRGKESLAEPNDLWHLGSDTKAMTATLMAKLVEKKKLAWNTTVGDVFADDGFKIHPDFQGVTVLHLLSHRSGLPANLKLVNFLGTDAPAERRRAVETELAKPPQSEPGTKFEYSNLGYLIAAAMAEKLTGKSWHDNMVEHVFGPLKMTSAGLGGTGTPGKLDQPWSHAADGRPLPTNGPAIDNPPVMGPAGRVHCTMQDWSKYVADMLSGLNGKPALLETDSYKKLTTAPFGGEYALGWGLTKRPWGDGQVLQHSGSNTMNFAIVWVAPRRDFAVLTCTNQGGNTAQVACDAAAGELIKYYLSTMKK
jgi:CubicO group peptidase (beta-lactamase class C family)